MTKAPVRKPGQGRAGLATALDVTPPARLAEVPDNMQARKWTDLNFKVDEQTAWRFKAIAVREKMKLKELLVAMMDHWERTR